MFRATFVVSLLATGGAGLSLLNQLILARYFGAGGAMDSYLIAVSMPLTVAGLLGGVLGYQLVPALLRAEQSRAGGADRLVWSLALGLGGGSAAVAFCGFLCAKPLVLALTPSLSAEQGLAIAQLSRIAWFYLPIAITSAIYVAALHARQVFVIATLAPSAPVLGSITGSILGHDKLGVSSVVWGQLCGYALMIIALRLSYVRIGVCGGGDWLGFRRIMKDFPYALASLLVFICYPFVDAFWGARIGQSAVSYLGYGQRFVVGFAGIAVVGLSTVVFPRMARHAAEGRGDSLRHDLSSSVKALLLCMVPCSAILGATIRPVVRLLFLRGSFDERDADALGALLPFMLCGMVAMSCAGLLFKALFATNKILPAALISLFGALGYFTLAGVLGCRWGLNGVGVAYALAWWAVIITGFIYFYRAWLKRDKFRMLLRFSFRLLLGTACAWSVAYTGGLLVPNLAPEIGWMHVLILLVLACVSLLVYIVIGDKILRISEIKVVVSAARSGVALMTKQVWAFVGLG